jgi:hypothetical protein
MLWSFRSIDTRTLAAAWERELGIKVSLRFAVITVDRTPVHESQQIRALHVWAASAQIDTVKQTLYNTYRRGSTDFPIDIKMRFIPMADRFGGDLDRLEKIRKLRSIQGTFLQMVEANNLRSWDIMTLETPSGELPSLRQLIMSERSKDDVSQLFLSVDYAYKRSDLVIFTFLPRNEKEAKTFVNNLAAYMIFKYQSNPEITSYFTPEACNKTKNVEWDPINNMIITIDDKYIDDIDFNEDEFLGFEDSVTQNIAPINANNNRIENLFLGREADSIGTLQTDGTMAYNRSNQQGNRSSVGYSHDVFNNSTHPNSSNSVSGRSSMSSGLTQ